MQGLTYGQDVASKFYNDFLDTLEGKGAPDSWMDQEEKIMRLESRVRKLEEALAGKANKKEAKK
jgi:hypothetical protein